MGEHKVKADDNEAGYQAFIRSLLEEARALARKTTAGSDCDIALVGILPTLSMEHLGLDSMMPEPRYFALNDAMRTLRGEEFRFSINGIDQLAITHDSVMLEACNTSFQVHSDPVTVSPETSTVEAIRLMREKQLACLPVLRDGKLVGLVTEHDLIVVSSHLLEAYLGSEGKLDLAKTGMPS